MDTENFTQCSFDPALAMERYKRMNLRSTGKNCISAALYLSGAMKSEKYIDPTHAKEIVLQYFFFLCENTLDSIQVPSNAVLIALVEISKPDFYFHLALINPNDRDQVIHRPGEEHMFAKNLWIPCCMGKMQIQIQIGYSSLRINFPKVLQSLHEYFANRR